MEILISAVASDLISRFISSVTQNYRNHIHKEDDRRRLERILLRMHSVVEEAGGRHITNQGMILQLKGLVEGFYLGYYMLDKIKFQPPEEESIEYEIFLQINFFLVWSRKFEEDMLISVVAKVIMSTISSPSRVQTIKEYLEKLAEGKCLLFYSKKLEMFTQILGQIFLT
ncbi:uncharacterized protein LOC127754586 [Oryza glaberrima]|uniref:uncharacterized protein LOC127754586 n=1 Tax=Oryza glaberrima TaxID=4538 RepID=UPI00224BEBFE|nr:uncharacterized protein LOC127754586 [Oryza glaberrima]